MLFAKNSEGKEDIFEIAESYASAQKVSKQEKAKLLQLFDNAMTIVRDYSKYGGGLDGIQNSQNISKTFAKAFAILRASNVFGKQDVWRVFGRLYINAVKEFENFDWDEFNNKLASGETLEVWKDPIYKLLDKTAHNINDIACFIDGFIDDGGNIPELIEMGKDMGDKLIESVQGLADHFTPVARRKYDSQPLMSVRYSLISKSVSKLLDVDKFKNIIWKQFDDV